MSPHPPLRAPESTAMNSNEKKILILTSAAHYLTHFFVLVFPVLVMPISRDLSMEPADVIKISFPMYLCYGLLAIPWGYLSDRFDARLMMGAGLIIAGIGFLATGLAESIGQLTLCLGVIGVGCSAYHPSGLALLSKGIRVRGRAMGINGLWGNFGIASAPSSRGSSPTRWDGRAPCWLSVCSGFWSASRASPFPSTSAGRTFNGAARSRVGRP